MSSRCQLRLKKANLQPSTREGENRETGEVWQSGDIAPVMLANGPEGRPDSSPGTENREGRRSEDRRTFNLRPAPNQNNYSWASPHCGVHIMLGTVSSGPWWVRLAGPKEPLFPPLFPLLPAPAARMMRQPPTTASASGTTQYRTIITRHLHCIALLCASTAGHDEPIETL